MTLSLLCLRSEVAELKCCCCHVDNEPSVLALAWPVTGKSTLFFHLRYCKHTRKNSLIFPTCFYKPKSHVPRLSAEISCNSWKKDAKSFPLQESLLQKKRKKYIYYCAPWQWVFVSIFHLQIPVFYHISSLTLFYRGKDMSQRGELICSRSCSR